MSKPLIKVSVVGRQGVFWANLAEKKSPKPGSNQPRIPIHKETGGSKPMFSVPLDQIHQI